MKLASEVNFSLERKYHCYSSLEALDGNSMSSVSTSLASEMPVNDECIGSSRNERKMERMWMNPSQRVDIVMFEISPIWLMVLMGMNFRCVILPQVSNLDEISTTSMLNKLIASRFEALWPKDKLFF